MHAPITLGGINAMLLLLSSSSNKSGGGAQLRECAADVDTDHGWAMFCPPTCWLYVVVLHHYQVHQHHILTTFIRILPHACHYYCHSK
jgi:hypothetical protein